MCTVRFHFSPFTTRNGYFLRPQKCKLTPPRAHLRLETDDFGTLPPESQKKLKKLSGCPDIRAFEATSSQNALVSRARRRLIAGNCLIIAVIVVIAYFNYHSQRSPSVLPRLKRDPAPEALSPRPSSANPRLSDLNQRHISTSKRSVRRQTTEPRHRLHNSDDPQRPD